MSANKQEWWKGSFPSWLVAGLLAVNCYFVKRHVERTEAMLFDHEQRISKIEGGGRKVASSLASEFQAIKANQ